MSGLAQGKLLRGTTPICDFWYEGFVIYELAHVASMEELSVTAIVGGGSIRSAESFPIEATIARSPSNLSH